MPTIAYYSHPVSRLMYPYLRLPTELFIPTPPPPPPPLSSSLCVCVFRYYCIAELVEEVEEQLERLRDDYHKICRVPVITSLEEETRIVSTSMKVHYTLYMQHCLASHL